MKPTNPLWDRIVQARKAVGISAIQLFKKAHCCPSAVYAIRDGKTLPAPDIIARIADVVQQPREEFLELAGYPRELEGDPWARRGVRGPKPGFKRSHKKKWLEPRAEYGSGVEVSNPGSADVGPTQDAIANLAAKSERAYFPAKVFPRVCEPRGPGARGSWDWVDWHGRG